MMGVNSLPHTSDADLAAIKSKVSHKTTAPVLSDCCFMSTHIHIEDSDTYIYPYATCHHQWIQKYDVLNACCLRGLPVDAGNIIHIRISQINVEVSSLP